MFCKNCGGSVPDGTEWCGRCGAPVGPPTSTVPTMAPPPSQGAPPPFPAQPVTTAYGPPGVPPRPPRANRAILWGIIAAVVIVLGAGGGVAAFLLTRGDGDANSGSTDGALTSPTLFGETTPTQTTPAETASAQTTPSQTTPTDTGASTEDTGATGTSETGASVTTPSVTETTEPQPAWTEREPAGGSPEARHSSGMVYNDQSNLAVIFGGCDKLNGQAIEYNDIWSYDPAADRWDTVSSRDAGPDPRHDLSMLSVGSGLLVYGGMDALANTVFRQTWTFNLESRQWLLHDQHGDVPSGRQAQAMAWDAAGGHAILFGGEFNGDELGDLYTYEPNHGIWTRVYPDGNVPEERHNHSMVYDPMNNTVYLFGGCVTQGDSLVTYDDLWALDCATNTWEKLAPAGDRPGRRAGHAMVFDSRNERLILFGGYGGTLEAGPLNDMWAYDPEKNKWTQLLPPGDLPQARWFHSMTYDSDTGQVILFGGRIDVNEPALGDTWVYGP